MRNSFENVERVQQEFESATDRAAAIVGGAFLDEILLELLREHLVKDPKNDKRLFEGYGPLATFSSRIDISYRLGLISAVEHKALHTIRAIRNQFAHRLDTVAFDAQSIRDLCRNIEVSRQLVAPSRIPLPVNGEPPPLPVVDKADSGDPRAVFEEAVITHMHLLGARWVAAAESRRSSPDAFSTALEPAQCMLDSLERLAAEHKALLSEIGELSEDDAKLVERVELLIRLQRFCVKQIRASEEESPDSG